MTGPFDMSDGELTLVMLLATEHINDLNAAIRVRPLDVDCMTERRAGCRTEKSDYRRTPQPRCCSSPRAYSPICQARAGGRVMETFAFLVTLAAVYILGHWIGWKRGRDSHMSDYVDETQFPRFGGDDRDPPPYSRNRRD